MRAAALRGSNRTTGWYLSDREGNVRALTRRLTSAVVRARVQRFHDLQHGIAGDAFERSQLQRFLNFTRHVQDACGTMQLMFSQNQSSFDDTSEKIVYLCFPA